MARKRKKRNFKPSIAIVGEGKTEQIYFRALAQKLRFNIQIKPEIPKSSDIKKLVETAKNAASTEVYDKVFLLVELDKCVHNNSYKEKVIKELERVDTSKIEICFLNPCFEFWFLLHLQFTGRHYTNCGNIIKELEKKAEFENYQKTQVSNYEILYSIENIKRACKNAKRLFNNYGNHMTIPLENACAEVYKIMEKLLTNT